MKKSMLLLSMLLTATFLQAEVRPVVKLGIDGGTGDSLATVRFTTGEKEEIDAGTGFSIEGGVEFDTDATLTNWKTQLLVGYKGNSIDASNASIDITRVTLTALELYDFGSIRLGAGLTYHISPTLEGDGFLSGIEVELDNAFGGVVQVGYNFTYNFTLGLKATIIDYEDPIFHTDIEASSVGIFGSYRF